MPDRRYSYVWIMRLRTHRDNGNSTRWFPRPGPVVVSAVMLEALHETVRRYNQADPTYEHGVARAPTSVVELLTRCKQLFHDGTRTTSAGDGG